MAEFDLIVIGSGPGGYVGAIRASQLGLKVALVEKKALGGVCLNVGCIPTKSLLKSAELYKEIQRASEFGIDAKNVKANFTAMIDRSRGVADKMSKGVAFLMKKNKINVFMGSGKLKSATEVEVTSDKGTEVLKAKNILIATGARARSLPNIAVDDKKIITSTQALLQTTQPKSLLVIGAGAIGVEFAYFYNAVGTEVTIVEYLDQLVPVEDADVGKELSRSFKKQGIKVKTAQSVTSAVVKGNQVEATIESNDGSKKETMTVDQVLVAVGVQGNVEDLGLEGLGVKTEKSYIQVNEKYETNVKGVFAIGDVNGPPWLAHVASAEAIRCVEWIAGHEALPINYQQIPGCTYCHPQVASIGYTEKAAKEAGIDVKVGKFPLSASGKASAIGDNEGFVKKVFDSKYDELIGVHIIGPEATELLTASSIALSHEATAQSILSTIHAHPTLGEALMEAAAVAQNEAIHI